ncbi:hypothetical protein HZB58_04195 [Candidatus Gottesmanbacteria bacterium]|nr:hypothetical protein [Candidatus Gottesmanbacteria bacterium]
MALPETTYLSPVRFRSTERGAQACDSPSGVSLLTNDGAILSSRASRQIVHVPGVDVPERWKQMLPHQQFVTVLPYPEAAQFRELSRSASITERDDGNYDVIGVFRGSNRKPVWMTGILSSSRQWATGLLDFGGRHRREIGKPDIAFSILYGHPNTVGFDWDGLYEALEMQFRANGLDTDMRKKMVRAWTPRLRPLADTMDRLEESAFAVVFAGLNKHRGHLAELGITKIPVLTDIAKRAFNYAWPHVPYEVGLSGWFRSTRLTEGDHQQG